MKVRKAVIPVAGFGTRFLPATKAIPKEMLPIVDRPAIQYIVEEAVRAGIEEIVLVTARGKEALLDHFDLSPELEAFLTRHGRTEQAEEVRGLARLASFSAVRQIEPLGLGHAILTARYVVGHEPFAVLLGDDVLDSPEPVIGDLLRVFEETGGGVVSLMEVPEGETVRYGVAAGHEVSPDILRIERVVEKPPPGMAPSRMAIVGRYVLPPSVFDILARTPPGAGGEVQLTDALRELIGAPGLFGAVFRGAWFDIGDKVGFLMANVCQALRRPDLAGRLRPILRSALDECP